MTRSTDQRDHSEVVVIPVEARPFRAHGVRSGMTPAAIKRALHCIAWDIFERSGFDDLIQPGARVVLKPNLVLHRNHGPWGIDPLITHQALIEAIIAIVRA